MIDYKIFQIGFNKCGTTSIFDLFANHTNPPIKSIHWDYGLLAKSIMDNLKLGNKLLSPKYETFSVFTDMECCFKSKKGVEWFFAFKHFHEIDQQYPGSKFILNTRNFDSWIRSRTDHVCRTILNENNTIERAQPYNYVFKNLEYLNRIYGRKFTQEDIVKIWNNERECHHKNVLNYFKHRPKDLLVFDIENDNFDKFKAFFSDIEFKIDCLPVSNKSSR